MSAPTATRPGTDNGADPAITLEPPVVHDVVPGPGDDPAAERTRYDYYPSPAEVAESRPRAPLPTPFDHLTEEQIEEIGKEFDALRTELDASLGDRDRAYIKKVIKAQRLLEIGGRGLLFAGLFPPAWAGGVAMLSIAKIVENMELGHNIMHGQWDWMRDPDIHSGSWDWDNVVPAANWKHSHNEIHHVWTNVLGIDRDLGYGLVRVDEKQTFLPQHRIQLVTNAMLALFFEWFIAVHDVEVDKVYFHDETRPAPQVKGMLKTVWRKVRKQVVKDYVAFPLIAGPAAGAVLTGNIAANLIRNVWAHAIIFCGHFPAEAAVFSPSQVVGESRGQWYLRQMAGSCNISGGKALDFMSGNLSHQIEHHCFPDIPSNRYVEIAPRVREICERYQLPYVTGPLWKQYGSVWVRLAKLSVPPKSGAPIKTGKPGRQKVIKDAA
jgi:fatty acid desaturase